MITEFKVLRPATQEDGLASRRLGRAQSVWRRSFRRLGFPATNCDCGVFFAGAAPEARSRAIRPRRYGVGGLDSGSWKPVGGVSVGRAQAIRRAPTSSQRNSLVCSVHGTASGGVRASADERDRIGVLRAPGRSMGAGTDPGRGSCKRPLVSGFCPCSSPAADGSAS